MSFATFLHWLLGKLDALGADAPRALRGFAQHTVKGGSPQLYQASAAGAEMNTKVNGRDFQVKAAAIARPDEQRRPSLLCNLRSFFVQDAIVYCPFTTLISPFLTDIEFARSKGLAAVYSFRTDVATMFQHVIYTSSIVMASCVTESCTKNRVVSRGSTLSPYLCSTSLG